MVTQNQVRVCEGKQDFFEKNSNFKSKLMPYVDQITYFLPTGAPIFEFMFILLYFSIKKSIKSIHHINISTLYISLYLIYLISIERWIYD